jgi:molybdopterin/thiamine biosynthesis adenylyltransferase/molybdopterin synthase catalytic subunit/rhodanese-related sulfurtransferase
MFSLATENLNIEALKASAADPACGALVTFEGWVRNHNDGHDVTALEYEAYEQLALTEGQGIVADAIEKFGLKQAICIHRVGRLEIGELAVWVGVATPHRDAAFKACRYIIDEIKVRVPIWKKEHYVSGDSGWVNCEECAKHNHKPKADYSRQTVLKEIGETGQQKLNDSRVLVVGAGGLGCPVLAHLAGAGIGHIGLIEHDQLEASNLHRQFLYSPDQVGQSKAALAEQWLKQHNPEISIECHDARFQSVDIKSLLGDYDIIVECTDCMETKMLVNRAAIQAGVPVVFASIYQFEGQVQVVTPDSSCLECLYEGGAPKDVPTCAIAGVLGPVPGVLGSIQALEAIKQLLQLTGRLENELLIVNLADYGMRKIALPRNPACAAHDLGAELPESVDIHISEIGQLGKVQIVDIRRPEEVQAEPLPCEHIHIPMDQLLDQPQLLEKEATHLLVCAAGVRTQYTANALRSVGYKNVYSLIGGNRVLDR